MAHGLLSCSRQTFSHGTHVGSSILTRDRTRAPCIGSMESQPLCHQESTLPMTLLSVKYNSLGRHFSFHWDVFLIEKKKSIENILKDDCTIGPDPCTKWTLGELRNTFRWKKFSVPSENEWMVCQRTGMECWSR